MSNLYFNIINKIIADTLMAMGRERHTQQVVEFVEAQVSVMPDYLRFGIQLTTILANYLFLPFHFCSFAALSPQRKMKYFELFGKKKLPIIANLYRFHASLIILKTLELDAEKI